MSPAPTTRRPGRPASTVLPLAIAATLMTGCATTGSSSNTAPPAADASKRANTSGLVTTTNGIDIVHADWAGLGYRWQWSADPIASGRDEITQFDVFDDTIAVHSVDSWTALLNANTGTTLWQVRNTSQLTSFVDNVRVNDIILSCGRPEIFVLEHGSGNLIARQPVSVVVTTPPVIFGGLAVFGTPIGEVLCHRFGTQSGDPLPPPLDDGAKEWGYLLDGAITAAPVLIGSAAGIVTQSGTVFFVDIPTGSGLGRASIAGGMATDPVTDGRLMYVASLDQSIYAFDPQDSTYRWRYRTASALRSQPTYHDGVLYVHVPTEGLIAFDVSEQAQDNGKLGDILWTNTEVDGHVVAVRSDELVVWNGSSASLVDRVAGDTIATADLSQFDQLVASTLVDGDLYAIASNGLVTKFSPR